jgi:hypothetical protein
MPERDQPDLDQVRAAMREHDARPEGPAAGDEPERGEPGPADDEPAAPERDDDDDERPPGSSGGG